jgi:DNA repair protein RadB
MDRFYLNPNTSVIEDLIGHYKSGQITNIYGNAASGKTTICFLAAAATARNSKVIYVDTEKGFSSERIRHFSNEDVLSNIFLLQPKDFKEQHDTILKLKKFLNDKIKLVIVDTIGNYYRDELNRDPKKINSMMAQQLANLIRVGRDLNKVVLITNQVYSDLKSKNNKMVGSSLVSKMCKCIIEMHKFDRSRYAILKKYDLGNNTTHYQVGKKLKYEIRKKGLFVVK